MPRHVLVFDVNETLLDLARLDPLFTELFGDVGARSEWFALMLRWSMVVTLTDRFQDFSALADASLTAVADARGLRLDGRARQRVFEQIRALPPHDDVLPALRRLHEAGFRLAALTNSARATVEAQLDTAGIAQWMERILSVDAVGRFKPHPEVYRHAARELGGDTRAIRLIAAHDWDITGALSAGCAAAFVARGGAVLHPAGLQPELTATDLAQLADRLIADHR